MKNKNELLSGIIFILLILTSISNIKVFISYVEQQQIVNDIQFMIPKLSLEKAESFNYEYPTLNVFTQPLKSYLGRVYLREGKYDLAIKTLQQARKENPFLLVNENFLSDIYRNLKIDDSVKYYSALAFSKMPNNALHFESYLQTISIDDTLSIDNAFEKIKIKDIRIWIAYLAGTLKFKFKSVKMLQNITYAKENYYDNSTLRLLIDYHQLGKDKVDKSIDLNNQGIKLMNERQHYESLEPFLEAYKLTPENTDLLLNIASSYFVIEKYKDAKFYIDSVIEDYILDMGKYKFIKGIVYCENQKLDEGCDLLTQAIKYNFNDAYKAKLKYCN